MYATRKFTCLPGGLLAACVLLQPGVFARAASATQHLVAARGQLERRADADSLAAASLLAVPDSRELALSLLARAEAAAPRRPDIVWLHIQVCRQVPSCDTQPLEHRLRELDPANGVSWLASLARADAAKDDAAVGEALDGLATSERVDIYWTILVGKLSQATYGTGKVPLPEAVTATTGLLAAEAIPAYQLTTHACKADVLGTTAALERCRAIARSLQRGDTYLTEMIGVAIAKRVWPQGSPDWQAADAARRTYDYRSQLPVEPDTAESMKRYVALCLAHAREQDVLRQQIIDAGMNPNPPAAP